MKPYSLFFKMLLINGLSNAVIPFLYLIIFQHVTVQACVLSTHLAIKRLIPLLSQLAVESYLLTIYKTGNNLKKQRVYMYKYVPFHLW